MVVEIWGLGEFNDEVGGDYGTYNALGSYGIGKVNKYGLYLLQICYELELFRDNMIIIIVGV